MNDFENKFKEINYTLIEYGWIISPYMIGRDFNKVYLLVQNIKQSVNIDVNKREVFLKEINELLTDIIFHPLFRAFFVRRAKELNYLKSVSHHIERAIFHYYNNDFFSGIHCLLPAIEGVLLSYFGWNFKENRKPNIDKLIAEIKMCRVSMHPRNHSLYKMYSEIISLFLKRWIFSDTSTADTTFSYLNRHYVLHGMGTDNYYSLSDFHRMIMFFDLLTEFLSLEQNINYNFIPENDDLINRRRDYYFQLIENNPKRDMMMRAEAEFMCENTNYIAEKNPPNWNIMISKFFKEHIELMMKIKLFNNKKQ